MIDRSFDQSTQYCREYIQFIRHRLDDTESNSIHSTKIGRTQLKVGKDSQSELVREISNPEKKSEDLQR